MNDIATVIPCYNGARFVEQCLDSAWWQTLAPTEIIIVDDGSTDDSVDRIQEWSRHHPDAPVRLLCQSNKGVSAARNTGWQAATSSWIAFLDADDILDPNHNEILTTLIKKYPSSVFAFCDAKRFDVQAGELTSCFENARIPELLTGTPEASCIHGDRVHTQLVTGSFVPTCCTLISRSALLSVGGFDEEIHFGEDRLMWLKLFNLGSTVISLRVGAQINYHNYNATHGRNKTKALLNKLVLYDLLEQKHDIYNLTPEQISLVHRGRAGVLNGLRYCTSASGLRSMQECRALLRSRGHSFSPRDWTRGIVASFTARLRGSR